MEEETETTAETKHSGGFGMYAMWAGVVLLVYVLSWGPCIWARRSARLSHPTLVHYLHIFYLPIDRAYESPSPLRKPLEMYLQLWRPVWVDKIGNPYYLQ